MAVQQVQAGGARQGGGGHPGPFGIKENFRRGTVVQVSEVTGGVRALEAGAGGAGAGGRSYALPAAADVAAGVGVL